MCRGQSYDNASHMSGKYSGVQARIIKINQCAHMYICDEIMKSLDTAEQYSYQYNIKITGVPQFNEKESVETFT